MSSRHLRLRGKHVTGTRSRCLFVTALAITVIAGLVLRFHRFAPPGSRANPAAPLAALPPGLDSDEAFHTLAALRLARGEIVPFFKIDQGIPAATIYLIALVFQFIGPVAEAGRIASAIMGIAALIGIPALAWRLFPDHAVAAIAAAANVAFTFWFVNFSRIGLEQIAAAALITLAVAAFWEWQTRGGTGRAVTCGLTLAIALYSYPVAYVLPIVIALHTLCALTLATPRWRPRQREMIAAAATLALFIAPLALFFFQNPEWVTRRSAQTAGDWMQLIPNLLRTVRGIVWHGDEIVRHNIPGRPLLDPTQTALFIIGLLYCIYRWREAPFALLLVWFGVMILPPALSDSPEHFGRIAGATSAITLIAGAGAIPMWQRLPRWLAAPLVVAAFAFSAARTAYDYFILWPQAPAYLDVFDFPERIQAEAIASLPPATAAYLSPSDRSRPMFAYLWNDAPRAQSVNGRVCTVFPEHAERDTVWLVNTLEDTRTGAILPIVFSSLETQVLFVENGATIVTQHRVSRGAKASVNPGSLGRVSDLVEIAAARVSPATTGAALSVNFQWRIVGSTAEDWTVGLYLLDDNIHVKAQDDRQPCDNSYPTSVWQIGEIIDEDRTLLLPSVLPPGQYTLAIAFYRLAEGVRLPTFAADGAQDTLLRIARISVP